MSEDAHKERGRKALPCSLIWVVEAVAQNLVVRQPEDREEEHPVVMVVAEDQVVTVGGLVEVWEVIDDLPWGAGEGPTLGEVRVVQEAPEVQGALAALVAETTRMITTKTMRTDQVGVDPLMTQMISVRRCMRY